MSLERIKQKRLKRAIERFEKKEACKKGGFSAGKICLKVLAVVLIIELNGFGLFAIGNTFAYFNDAENSADNSYSAGTLDFYLSSLADFSPVLDTPITTASRTIEVINEGSLGFFYSGQTSNASGILCDYLNITAKLNSITEYSGSLMGFAFADKEFSSPQTWEFSAALATTSEFLENTTCNFDFVFNGQQATSSFGFSDQETINNTITAGSFNEEPPPITEKCVKINEVYYDPDAAHGSADDEWIEIYNACSYQVNLKDWELADNSSSTEPINGNHTLDPGQFLVLSSNASTWTYWPLVPSNAVKIALGGTELFNGLNNDSDRVFLYDNSGNQIDEVSWGQDVSAFDPSVLGVGKGHSIARKTKGVDTDTVNDWEDLSTPNPGTNPHSFSVGYLNQQISSNGSQEQPDFSSSQSDLFLSLENSTSALDFSAETPTGSEPEQPSEPEPEPEEIISQESPEINEQPLVLEEQPEQPSEPEIIQTQPVIEPEVQAVEPSSEPVLVAPEGGGDNNNE